MVPYLLCSTRVLHLNLGHLNPFKKCRGPRQSRPTKLLGHTRTYQKRPSADPKGLIPSDKVLVGLGGYGRVFGCYPMQIGQFQRSKPPKSRRQTLPRNPSSFCCIQLRLLRVTFCHAPNRGMLVMLARNSCVGLMRFWSFTRTAPNHFCPMYI